jgi:hypothetical protein
MHANFVQHLINDGQLPIMARKSFKNCHVKGLYSIMLLESPERTIRLYYADKDHELYKNSPDSESGLSLGFHNHHCNITLDVKIGTIKNWTAKVFDPETDKRIPMSLQKFRFKSYINNGVGGFEALGESKLVTKSFQQISDGYSKFLSADDLHTVYVAEKASASWFVYEGRENRDHDPICHSNTDLLSHNTEGLYGRIAEEEIMGVLKELRLLS